MRGWTQNLLESKPKQL